MSKNRPLSYDKITQQQKFRLLYLISNEKMTVKEVTIIFMKAADDLKINYSTAKTIIFFNKKDKNSNYTFYRSSLFSSETLGNQQVSYKHYEKEMEIKKI